MRVLEAVDLYRFYHTEEEETLALRGVSLHLDRGEIVAVMGPSGSGKSTLLSCLAGLDEPDGGFVSVMGKRLTRRTEAERATRRATEIGLVLQSQNLFDHLSVEEHLRFQMYLARRFDKQRLEELLTVVGLRDRRAARPTQLSGGEAARAALAVALAPKPNVLLADEPTGEVDEETEQQVLHLFDSYRREGGALLLATHSDAVAAQADRILHLQDGRLSYV